MKKITPFILIMMMVSALYADFKILGGINFSKYNIFPEENNVKWNYKRGFLAGIGLEKNFTFRTLLEFDILYFQKGGTVKFAEFPGLKEIYNLDVISIPILIRSKFLFDSSPYVLGGVEFSSILSHEARFEGEDNVDIKSHSKSIDFGFVFGCGYEIKMQEYLYFFIEARYHHGIRNIISDPDGNQSMKTNAILMIIGLRS